MVRDTLTHAAVETARASFSSQYYQTIPFLIEEETETMTDDTNYEKTEEILDKLRKGTYTTKCGDFIVRTDYRSVAVSANPARPYNYSDTKSIILTKDTLEELQLLVSLKEAVNDRAINKANIEQFTYELTTSGDDNEL